MASNNYRMVFVVITVSTELANSLFYNNMPVDFKQKTTTTKQL